MAKFVLPVMGGWLALMIYNNGAPSLHALIIALFLSGYIASLAWLLNR
ncbi:hypothetical protein FHS85_001696 [Rhodoligotrophos appendicifer]|nr:hypothetical protein [Rhodoligotrophos appendicifer]